MGTQNIMLIIYNKPLTHSNTKKTVWNRHKTLQKRAVLGTKSNIEKWHPCIFLACTHKKTKLSLSTPWRHVYRVQAQLHSFVTSTLNEGDCPTSRRRPFNPTKEPWDPLNKRLGELHSRSGGFGEEKHYLPQLGCIPRTVQPVSQLL